MTQQQNLQFTNFENVFTKILINFQSKPHKCAKYSENTNPRNQKRDKRAA